MARKIKKPKPPPISVLDGVVIALAMLLSLGWMIGMMMYLYPYLQEAIAVRDSQMRMWTDTAWMWMIFSALAVSMSILLIFVVWSPMPIFGNPKIRYGKYPYQDYAPIFSKTLNLKQHRPELYAESMRKTRLILAAALLSLLLGLPGLCPRNTISEDGTLKHYNTFNRCTETVRPWEIRSVTFTTRHRELSRGGEYWDFFVTADGYSFYSDNHLRVSGADELRFLLQFRTDMERRGVPIQFASDDPDTHLSVQELLPLIAADLGYDSEETALLYELFDGA